MSAIYQNMKQPNTKLSLPNELFQIFLFTMNDLFNIDDSIKKSESISIFKTSLLPFIRPVQSKYYNVFGPKGLKLLICLPLGFSHLNEHRFRHNFQDCVNLVCSCSLEGEDTLHYLLDYRLFLQFCNDLMNSVKSVSDNFETFPDKVKKYVLLYDDSPLDENKNRFILEATLTYIKSSERFSGSLFK